MAKKMRKCFKRIVETTAEVERPVKREDVGSDEWYRIKGEVEWNPNVTAEELNHFLSLHGRSERARGFNPGMNQADNIFEC